MELQLLNADLMQTSKTAIFLKGALASAPGVEGGKLNSTHIRCESFA